MENQDILSTKEPLKILIVDDESSLRSVLQKLLAPQGYTCFQAADAPAAQVILDREKIDLVLCDLQMPGESGLDLSRWIKKEHPNSAIIMVTGVDDPQQAQIALEIGVYGYIVKPFERNQILISIINALKRRALEIGERSYRQDLEKQVREKTRDLELTIGFFKESEAQFRSLAEGSIQGILIHRDLQPLFANQAFAQLHGYSLAEILRLDSILAVIAPHEQKRLLGYRAARLEGKPAPVHYEYQGVRQDGSLIWLESRVTVVQFDGAPAIQLTVADITDRKEATDALRRAHQEMAALISGISSVLIGLAADLRIIQWNKLAEETFGVRTENALGKSLTELGLHWEGKQIQVGLTQCQDQKRFIRLADIRFTHRDGKEGFLDITLNPIQTDDGRPPGVLLMGTDLTERKILEMQLTQAQKLESIGQLAAGIAHEINTPIQYVGDNTQFLKAAFTDLLATLRLHHRLLESVKGEEGHAGLIAEIEAQTRKADVHYLEEEIPLAINQTLEGVERISRIVLSMKEFSHPGTNQKTAVDINRALENTITVARNEWKYVAELKTELDPDLPPVPCIPGEINQVFLNILVNAAQAIGATAKAAEGRKGIIRIRTRQVNGDAEIRIGDNGPGIPAAIRERIFDPFFTTKEPGKGSGQGLAIVQAAVVGKHQGSIQLESREGEGTEFIIRLPLGIAAGVTP
ncbi:MAG: PAS domain S-box protein [Deltaproteobacteria bacterium]|nr:PAS domain S-box protein [Deltaproteobacteria bacterium]